MSAKAYLGTLLGHLLVYLGMLLSHFPAFLLLASAQVSVWFPLAIAFINQPRFSPAFKRVLSPVLCFVAAGVVCYSHGAFDPTNLTLSFGIIFAATWALYRYFYHPTNIAPAFEIFTSSVLPSLLGKAGQGVASLVLTTVTAATASNTSKDAVPLTLRGGLTVAATAATKGVEEVLPLTSRDECIAELEGKLARLRAGGPVGEIMRDVDPPKGKEVASHG